MSTRRQSRRARAWGLAAAALIGAGGCTAPLVQMAQAAPQPVATVSPALDTAVAATVATEPPPARSAATQASAPTVEAHVVAAGETLFTVAMRYGVDVAELAALNHLEGEPAVGQLLRLPRAAPGAHVQLPTVTPAPTPIALPTGTPAPASAPNLAPTRAPTPVQLAVEQTSALPAAATHTGINVGPPSLLNSDNRAQLDAFYTLAYAAGRFTLRYAPGSPVAQDPAQVAALVQRALNHHEQMLGIQLQGPFEAYAAATLFAPPDTPLRGYSFSKDRYFIFLHDGSGSAADQAYLAAHELMHLIAWNIWGKPTSFLVSEGVAVYAGMASIADSAQQPIDDFCLAFARQGRLPWVSDATLPYRGHNRNLDNYYAAGCFVGWLIETGGVDAFGRIYATGDFAGVYGQGLPALDAAWHAALQAQTRPLPFDEAALVAAVDQLTAAYAAVLATYPVDDAGWAAYRQLDALRMALMEGRLDDFFAALR